jgi:ATP phosphoribosyltransferase regulatory subunit
MSEFLLPSGLYDLLPPEAARQTYMLSTLLSRFVLMGYEQVIPPLLEYDESLLSGKGIARAPQTFRLADTMSQHMLGIRADITTQMARIAASRLLNAPKPLRLAYTGTVLRTRPTGLDNNRQLVQAGVECIGAQNMEAEVVITALEALTALELKDVVVDFSVAGLLKCLLQQENITDETTIEAIREQVRSKDVSSLPATLACKETLITLTQTCGAAASVLPTLKALKLPEEAKSLLAQLEAVIVRVAENMPHITLTIDALDSRGFDYHYGVCFALYLPSIQQEIGRGGYYTIPTENGDALPAVGVTLYVTRLLKAELTGYTKPTRVYIPYSVNYKSSAEVRERGYSTVYGTENCTDVKAEAKHLGCELILQDGALVGIEA